MPRSSHHLRVRRVLAAGVLALAALSAPSAAAAADPPVVSGVSDPSASGEITISGSHFTGTTAVRFDAASPVPGTFTVVSDSTIRATPTAPLTTAADVVVTSPAGASAVNAFSYADQTTPSAQITTTPVTCEFDDAAKTTIAASLRTDFHAPHAAVDVGTPFDAGAFDVSLAFSTTAPLDTSAFGTPRGVGATTQFFIDVNGATPLRTEAYPVDFSDSGYEFPTSADGNGVHLRIGDYALPTLTAFGPGGGDQAVRLSVVELRALTPYAGGHRRVDCYPAPGTAPTIDTVAKKAQPAPPEVTAVSTAEVINTGGDSIVISGHGFTGASAVSLGSYPVQSFTVDSDTTIHAITGPTHYGHEHVQVTAFGQTSSTSPVNDVFIDQDPFLASTSAVPVTCTLDGATGVRFAATVRGGMLVGNQPYDPLPTLEPGDNVAVSQALVRLQVPDSSAISGYGLQASLAAYATVTSIDYDVSGSTLPSLSFSGGSQFAFPVTGSGNGMDFTIGGGHAFALGAAGGGSPIRVLFREFRATVPLFATGATTATESAPLDCVPSGGDRTVLTIPVTPTRTTLSPRYVFSSGAATLHTLTRGTLPLTGTVSVDAQLPSGAAAVDLFFNQTTATVTALGVLPLRAKVNIDSEGTATGTLADDALSVNARLRIRVPSLTLFGLQLVSANGCQTKTATPVVLQSRPGFDEKTGGTLAGRFTFGDLQNCGSLTGLLRTLISGGGNTLTLALTPFPT